jgi:hypothetical protein
MSFLGDDGGYSQHGWSGDNYHYMVFRGITNAAGTSISATDNYTFREYASGSTTNSPFLFMQGGPNETVQASIGGTGYFSYRLGIATQSPSYALHVNGTFYAAGSSKEYKYDIKNYKVNGETIDKLRPVEYKLKDEWLHLGKNNVANTQIGLIAEEVAKDAPELAITIKELGEDVIRNVDYEKLTILLLSEVQQLRKRVLELEEKYNV